MASLYVRITWGRPGILSEKKYLDYLEGRKLFAYSAAIISMLSQANLLF